MWALLCALGIVSPASAQVVSLPGLSAPIAPQAQRAPQVLEMDEDAGAVREKLKRRINVDWTQVKLQHAVDNLRRELGVDMQLDPEGLEEAGVDKEQEIESLSCRDRRGDQVLRLLLSPLHMSYVIQSGVVMLTSEEKAAEQLTTRAYNVRDLLEPWSPKRNQDVGTHPLPVPEGTKVVWSKKGLYARSEYYEAANEVIDLITTHILPDSWSDNGGSGSINIYRGLLIVSQTEEVHGDLEMLLRQIRAGEHSQPGDVIQLTH
jgi:hypothetical protein